MKRSEASHSAQAYANQAPNLTRVILALPQISSPRSSRASSSPPGGDGMHRKSFSIFTFSIHSFSFAVTLHQLKDCNCCSVSEVREMPVELVCEDNYRLIKHFNIPSSCSCTKCDGEKGKLLKLTATSWWKIFSGNRINKLQIDKTHQLPNGPMLSS